MAEGSAQGHTVALFGGVPFARGAGCVALILVGAIGLITGIQTDPVRAWQAYLVNFLFFTGIGSGAVLFVCAVNMSSGRWGRNVKRVAEGLGAFTPVSFVLYVLMIPGMKHILPWVKHPYGARWWLDLRQVIWRDATGLLVLALIGIYIIYLSVRVDLGHSLEKGSQLSGPVHRWVARRWRGITQETHTARRRLGIMSPVYGITFAFILTMIAVDFIMSLKKDWHSTLLGAYYFVGCFYVSLAALMIAVIWARKTFDLHDQIRPHHLHDIAKLTMAFGIVTGDFFYTQLLVIWYGNLPDETSFLIDRMHYTPWRWIGVAVLILCFLLPLIAMLKESLKKRAVPMLVFSTTVLAAVWMERFFLVGPSVTGKATIRFGAIEVLVTLGFLGALGLTFFFFIHRVPPVVLRDPVFDTTEETP